jgi:hypothetical protein
MPSAAPRISHQTDEFLTGYFATKNAGCEFVLDALPTLYHRTMQEMKGRFSRSELAFLLDISNGVMMVTSGMGRLAGQHIGLSVSDSFGMYPGRYEAEYGVDADTMSRKLNTLTAFQLVCLEIWIEKFWRDKSQLDEYVKQLG